MASFDEPGRILHAAVAKFSQSCFQILFLALALSQLASPLGCLAQQVSLQSKRKLIVDVRPIYPLLARKANLSGLVRLRITVSPAGYPVDTELLGGSPVLVKAATDAVSKARWEPAPAETREIVQIRFEAKMGPSL